MLKSRGIVLLTALALSFACGGAPGTDTDHAADHPDGHAEIPWFEGTVEEAFALAKAEARPLFLYWGAEWCPPCHYLKNKIFKQPAFVAKVAGFVPVYLDGDTERAQILGEELDVQGYPTVIVFSPEGEEVMRMASSIPVAQYADVLDAAVQVMRPVGEVLTSVLETGPAEASRADLNLLAFYSWDQDSKSGLEDEARLETFRILYHETPKDLTLQRSRFFGLYLAELIDSSRGDEAPEIAVSDEERARLTTDMISILEDRDLRNSNLEPVLYLSRAAVDLLQPEASRERDRLVAVWRSAAIEAEEDEMLSLDDRLSALVPQIRLARLEQEETAGNDDAAEAELPAPLVDRIRERVSWAAEHVADGGELQAVMNTMVYLLRSADLEDEAESLLTEKMNDAEAPYYFMSYLASVKMDAGQPEEALAWYRKAYDSSRGRYSRFRWGSTYLRQLLEISPEDSKAIETDSLEILTELLGHDDAFALGNHSRLKSLAKAYESWNEAGSYSGSVELIRQHVHSECERYPDEGEDSQRSRCLAFLS
jgi:thiol-disulfide isomerase/thioredoxin